VAVIDRSPCAVCSNGLLELRRQDSSDRIFAECRECYTAYWQPDMVDMFRGDEVEWSSSEATMDEALRAGWPAPEVLG
jgi:uncharacterized protein with PIN domain